MHNRRLLVSAAQDGMRVDRFLCAALPGLGRAAARWLCEQGLATRDGRSLAAGARVRGGDAVQVPEGALDALPAPDPTLPLRVVHEDACLLVVDKPAGMPCHPLRPGEGGTLASALLARYPELAEVGRDGREPGLVHRLDTGTSGLLLVARDAGTFDALTAALRAGAIDKRYLALCAGAVRAPAVHHAYLRARGPRVTVREQPLPGGEPITTELLSSESAGAFSLVEVKASFARRHQVRAHLAALSHPLAGDARYGGPELAGLSHHALHAVSIALRHPRTSEPLTLRAELPAELRALLERLRRDG